VVLELYSRVAQKGVITVRDSTTAEIVKLFEGVYRDVNIALANELAQMGAKVVVLGAGDWHNLRDVGKLWPRARKDVRTKVSFPAMLRHASPPLR
jgi:hypothetical protein